MVYAAVVGRDIMGVEEDAFLYLYVSVMLYTDHPGYIHLLKLVTGVDTSTRPARRSGSAGKTVNRSNRTAAAAPKSSIFCCLSMVMVTLCYPLIGSMAVLHLGAGVLARCMLMDPCRANAGSMSASWPHLELFCARQKFDHLHRQNRESIRLYNGRSLEKEG